MWRSLSSEVPRTRWVIGLEFLRSRYLVILLFKLLIICGRSLHQKRLGEKLRFWSGAVFSHHKRKRSFCEDWGFRWIWGALDMRWLLRYFNLYRIRTLLGLISSEFIRIVGSLIWGICLSDFHRYFQVHLSLSKIAYWCLGSSQFVDNWEGESTLDCLQRLGRLEGSIWPRCIL